MCWCRSLCLCLSCAGFLRGVIIAVGLLYLLVLQWNEGNCGFVQCMMCWWRSLCLYLCCAGFLRGAVFVAIFGPLYLLTCARSAGCSSACCWWFWMDRGVHERSVGELRYFLQCSGMRGIVGLFQCMMCWCRSLCLYLCCAGFLRGAVFVAFGPLYLLICARSAGCSSAYC